MLIDKNVTFRSAHDRARMQDPLVLRHRAKVRLDPGAAGSRVPLVVITLTDGTRLSEDVAAVLGTVNNRMTREQVIAKCRDLITPVLGPQASDALINAAMNIENLKNVRELRSLLQRA
jgi:2-methylcitrate dehydratase PrpD